MQRRKSGSIIGIPNFSLFDTASGKPLSSITASGRHWHEEAVIFGNRLAKALSEVDDKLKNENSKTPAPDWSKSLTFRLDQEQLLEQAISEKKEQVEKFLGEKNDLEIQLKAVGSLRDLLLRRELL